jgi:hypothetical protein
MRTPRSVRRASEVDQRGEPDRESAIPDWSQAPVFPLGKITAASEEEMTPRRSAVDALLIVTGELLECLPAWIDI